MKTKQKSRRKINDSDIDNGPRHTEIKTLSVKEGKIPAQCLSEEKWTVVEREESE